VKSISIDEDGFFLSQGIRWEDKETCLPMFQSLRRNQYGAYISTVSGFDVSIEAFDHPFVAKEVHTNESTCWTLTMPYGHTDKFEINTLRLDDWDRFHGITIAGISFVLSRDAQAKLFNSLEEFDDESITWNGVKHTMGHWPGSDSTQLAPSFWNQGYQAKSQPDWDLGGPHPALSDILNQLKLAKSRILVVGSGRAHDAAHLANLGHLVTACDYSEEAMARAKELYSNITQLRFLQADVFNLPQNLFGQFDIVFEHTCYCAVDPSKRNDLAKIYRTLIHDQGHLLGIFPLYDRTDGPPFASSEWELRERFKKSFQFLYWTRSKVTTPKRLGQELILYAKKK
jgi:hypothetical protein